MSRHETGCHRPGNSSLDATSSDDTSSIPPDDLTPNTPRALAAISISEEDICSLPNEHSTDPVSTATTENTTFAVVDAPSANWVLRRILEARAYAASVTSWAEAETKRARDAEAFFLARYGDQLAAFAREAVAQQNATFKHDPRKSVKLPAGTLGFRTQPARFKVEDEATALLWCKLHLPQAVQTSEKVSRTALHEHYTATGELPLGSSLEDEHERFFIR